LESGLTLYKLSRQLTTLLDLKPGPNEGELINSEGDLICFDPTLRYARDPILIIRKDYLLNALKKENLSVFWTIYGEKSLMGDLRHNQFMGIRSVVVIGDGQSLYTREKIIYERE